MNGTALVRTTLTLGLVALLATEAHAMAPRDVDDLVGARASSGESQLMRRGYHYRKTLKVAGSAIAYWWNPARQACIAVTTADGRYKSIMDQPAAACDKEAMDAHGAYGRVHHGTQDLVGMRATNGERALRDRGYRFVDSQRGADRIWSNWWNASLRNCITVVTREGRYDAITDTLPADCDRESSSAGAEAPPGGFGRPTPRIMTVDNGNVSVDLGGCNVLFHPRGNLLSKGSSCTDGDVRAARDAFDAYRREQNAPASAEAPPGGFGGQGSGTTVTCEASNKQYQFCRHPIGPNASVRVQRRLSRESCIQGQSWGYDADGVWVDKGCRAVFEVR